MAEPLSLTAMFLISAAISALTTAITYVINRQLPQEAEGPSGDSFNVPTATEDRTVPMIFGTVEVFPNIAWYGNVDPRAYKEEGAVVAWDWYVDFFCLYGHGPLVAANGDGFMQFRANDKVAYENATAQLDTQITIDNPHLFGGSDKGGRGGFGMLAANSNGDNSKVDLLAGLSTQALSTYLKTAMKRDSTGEVTEADFVVEEITNTPPTGIVPGFVPGFTDGLQYYWRVSGAGTGLWSGKDYLIAKPELSRNGTIIKWTFPYETIVELDHGLRVYDRNSTATHYWDSAQSAWVLEFGSEATIPAWRGYIGAIFRNFYVGTGGTMPKISAVIRHFRTSDAFGTSDATYNAGSKFNVNSGDCNPMEIIYYLLTNNLNGAGIAASLISGTSFLAAATTLHTEGTGVSIKFEQRTTVNEMINEVLEHIDAILYFNLQTGLIEIKLIRADYDVSTLDTLDDTNCTASGFTSDHWNQTINQVSVTFIDRDADFKERPAMAQDLGNMNLQNKIVPQATTLRGFTTFANASAAAQRLLLAGSMPLKKVNIQSNREAWDFTPGQVFKWTNTGYGVTNLVMRVLNINYGALVEDAVEITAVQDKFSLPSAAYSELPPPGWVNPIRRPESVNFQDSVELPLFFYNSMDVLPQLSITENDVTKVMIMAAKPNVSCHSFDVYGSSS